MRVVITRAQPEAAQWADLLQQHGFDALTLPLIDIAAAADAPALADAWRALPGTLAVMFVSANAVRFFFAAQAGHAFEARAWATGPGTRQALRDAGVSDAQTDSPPPDAQFDSESLWQRVGSRVTAGDRVLIVRGSDAQGRGAGRDWFADQLQAKGAVVQRALAYRRLQPQWTEAQQAQASAAAEDGAVWLFSSSEAITNLCALLPVQSWRAARAVATHGRIAQAARDAGFGVVCESRPELLNVVASIESLR